MIRAVIDTNIVVSAFFWGKQPRQVLDAARNKQFHMITSDVLIEELHDVISRPKFASRLAQIGETPESLLESSYHTLVEVVEPATIPPVILDDPNDDALIACALGGTADYIVSGDKHLLNQAHYQHIKIVEIKPFLDIIQSKA